MKLFVDDIRTPPTGEWNIARSALTAVRAIDMFGITITDIALDHDISHQVVMTISRPYPCAETFEIVARYMALFKKSNPIWNPNVSIHTSNPAGAKVMKAILNEAGLVVEVELRPGANRLETIL